MTTHVFIVDAQTFPIHLQYCFAGTTAGEKRTAFVPLLADIKRVRPNDQVIFYVNRVGFYGLFRVADKVPLVIHEKADPGYLRAELGHRLIYRTRIEPDVVYPRGVSEWEALDKLPVYAQEVLWSLIYRKLKGERGCTPVFPHETKRLVEMIRSANGNHPLVSKKGLTWNPDTEAIEPAEGAQYTGELNVPPSLSDELVRLARRRTAHEGILEAYFSEQAGLDAKLNPICGEPSRLKWLGNQVFCGFGMQKIDVFTILEDERKNREFRVIELKSTVPDSVVAKQLLRYVLWTQSYIPGAINSNIQPILVSPRVAGADHSDVDRELKQLNEQNAARIVLWFEYRVEENGLKFEERKY